MACVSDEGSVTQHSPSLQNLVSGRVEKHSPCISSHENSVRGSVKLHSPSVQVPSLQADDCTSLQKKRSVLIARLLERLEQDKTGRCMCVASRARSLSHIAGG